MSQNIPKEKKKPRPRGARSGKSREFSKTKLNTKLHLQHKELLSCNWDTKDGNECFEENSTGIDFVHNNLGVNDHRQGRNCPSAKHEPYQWIKISCNEHLQQVSGKMTDQKYPLTFTSPKELVFTPKSSLNDRQQVRQELEATNSISDIDSTRESCLDPGNLHKGSTYENCKRKGHNRSRSCESNVFHNRFSKPLVKFSWQLDQKFAVTEDFPKNIICDDDETNHEENKPIKTTKMSFLKSNSDGLPSILTAQEISEGERLKREFTDMNKSGNPVKPEPKIAFSGKTCKTKLPSCFPGILSQQVATEPNDSVQEGASTPPTNSVISPGFPIRKWGCFDVPEKSSDPLFPVSEQPSPLQPPKTSGSTEYTAARIVGELDKAFTETLGGVSEEPGICITPTSMPTRYSATPSRRRSDTPLLDELTSVASFPHSHSMPNLHDHLVPLVPKRAFVTFEEDRPYARAVDLKAETEIAEKCRNLDLSMDSLGIANLKEKRIRKKTLMRSWMQACGHNNPNTRFVSGNRCYACRVHKTGQINQY